MPGLLSAIDPRRRLKVCLRRHLEPACPTLFWCLAWLMNPRYDDRSAREALCSIPDFVWCLNPKCSSGQIHSEGHAEPIFRCHACSFRTCTVCDKPWHEGQLCGKMEAMSVKEQETASASTIKRTSQRCPNASCKRPIEKTDGCDHMTCKLDRLSSRDRDSLLQVLIALRSSVISAQLDTMDPLASGLSAILHTLRLAGTTARSMRYLVLMRHTLPRAISLL